MLPHVGFQVMGRGNSLAIVYPGVSFLCQCIFQNVGLVKGAACPQTASGAIGSVGTLPNTAVAGKEKQGWQTCESSAASPSARTRDEVC